MSAVNQLVAIATRAWGISPANTGGALGKAPSVRVQFADNPSVAGEVTVTVFSTTKDGVTVQADWTNYLQSTQTYTPYGGAGSRPCGGPAEAAWIGATLAGIESLSQQLIATIVANGGTWP